MLWREATVARCEKNSVKQTKRLLSLFASGLQNTNQLLPQSIPLLLEIPLLSLQLLDLPPHFIALPRHRVHELQLGIFRIFEDGVLAPQRIIVTLEHGMLAHLDIPH